MANQLKMADIQAILALHRLGWSKRHIARELDINRETVGQYVRQAESKPASAPTGFSAAIGPITESNSSPADLGVEAAPATRLSSPKSGSEAPDNSSYSKPAGAPTGSAGAPIGNFAEKADQAGDGEASSSLSLRAEASAAWPWRDVIIAKLAEGLSVQRIVQDLQGAQHGYAGSYYSVRRLAQKLTGALPLPVRRMEVEAAQEAQVDFGRGAPVVGADGKRRTTLGVSHRAQSQPQGIRRGGVSANHR